MKNLRVYGKAPFRVAVIHGGPGAGGEMAPVARELALGRGVLEPIQTAVSLEGQVEELRTVLETRGDLPVTLIGFSWGAWLSFIVAARYAEMIRKLILVGGAPFEKQYVTTLLETRLSRLRKNERTEFESTLSALADPTCKDQNSLVKQLGLLASKTDTYDLITDVPNEDEWVTTPGDLIQNAWKDAAELRKSGQLLELGKEIKCPVVAIHGDYDPHPAEGVQKPLSGVLKDFRFILLRNCGHKPWLERQARSEFYRILEGLC